MRLLDDWREVLAKAWSIRLISVAVVLTLLDVGAVVLEGLGLLADRPAVSIGLRSLSALFGSLAFIARLVAQKDLHG